MNTELHITPPFKAGGNPESCLQKAVPVLQVKPRCASNCVLECRPGAECDNFYICIPTGSYEINFFFFFKNVPQCKAKETTTSIKDCRSLQYSQQLIIYKLGPIICIKVEETSFGKHCSCPQEKQNR